MLILKKILITLFLISDSRLHTIIADFQKFFQKTCFKQLSICLRTLTSLNGDLKVAQKQN